MSKIIELKNVSYKYPLEEKYALKDINLSIEKGKLYAIIGGNNSGKTTLCNTIRGFIPHFYQGELSGEVVVKNKEIRNWTLSGLSSQVGYSFQNPFTQISGTKDTVFEEIAYGLENLGVEPLKIKSKVNELLSTFEIEHLKDKNPIELSGGQKQRVALAAVIALDPEILVIDEPTSQLDPQGTEDIFKIIARLKEEGKTIILVEHKIDLIAEFADEIILMNNGKVAMNGKCEDILTDENVLNHGGNLPQYALLGIEMKKKNFKIEKIPYTKEGALEMLRYLSKKGE